MQLNYLFVLGLLACAAHKLSDAIGFDCEIMYCPDDYDPVCGTDGNKYSNLCELTLKACSDTTKELDVASNATC
ncbi:hypothetical protein PF005_g25008 [Phytophthora fragariae]|uniref:Kazal-like domain-containing protein n=2 Tax=Phytophthora TaxID=4783 RepID=A0A6A3RG73_9STRA|nr:hypothetical protein PF003_g34074 [Phytophthora fragariae]KAE8963571.1 hypothetical protein PR001_g29335 [Phytophthora rubi]KAE8925959.1 hypothetical protein PF009_g23846 [Phytophthora fragariae]KAE8977120.1 hypothetical protein PF011_g23782 [Phytophthora fragariae]KAE8981391.1 hypothetical protein PR002_g23848 [Phytophthora rubi]